MIVVPAEHFPALVQRLLRHGDPVFPEEKSAAKFAKLLVHRPPAVALLGLQPVRSGKDGSLLHGGQGEKDRPQIGAIGDVQSRRSRPDLLEILSVYSVALQAFGV